MYQRSLKRGIDNWEMVNIKDIKPKKDDLDICARLKLEELGGNPEASSLYKSRKDKLNCINTHNIGNHLEGEFISSGYLVYDIDSLSLEDLKKIVRFSAEICNIVMISPSRRGVKLFFRFEEDSITQSNLKLLYKNFGSRMLSKINNTLNIDIKLDLSSNDLNRLCFIGLIKIHEENEYLRFIPSDYYTMDELRASSKPHFSNDGENKTYDNTYERIDNSLKSLEVLDLPIALERYDLMRYGFGFASILKDEKISQQEAYQLFKRFMKLGEVNKTDEIWVTKSGNNNKYQLDVEFKTLIGQWGGNGMCARTTIGSFFHMCKEKGVTGYKRIIQNY